MTYTYQINPDALGDTTEAEQRQFVAACNRAAEKQGEDCRFELGGVFSDTANRRELTDEQREDAKALSNAVWNSDWLSSETADRGPDETKKTLTREQIWNSIVGPYGTPADVRAQAESQGVPVRDYIRELIREGIRQGAECDHDEAYHVLCNIADVAEF